MSVRARTVVATMTTTHPWAGGPHPWREWRDMPDVDLWWTRLRDSTQSLTDGAVNVWFDVRQSQVERRCNSRHEQEHILAGHTGCMSGPQEDRIRWRAAQWLCPNPRHVAEALIGAAGDISAAADHLWLDEPTMIARLDMNRRFMHPAERALINRLIAEEHHP